MALTITSDDIASLKAKHGEELRGLDFDGQTVVVRGPKPLEYKCFTDRAKDQDARLEALEELAKSCVVFPVADALDAFLAKRPGALVTAGGVVLELAGISDKVRAQKL